MNGSAPTPRNKGLSICGAAQTKAREARDTHENRKDVQVTFPVEKGKEHGASASAQPINNGYTSSVPLVNTTPSSLPAGTTGAKLSEEYMWLLPLPRADGDVEWGLGQETTAQADPAITAKLARFHELKKRGTHFNESLARNRAFHNPRIYATLVEWAGIDEYGSNYEPIARAAGVLPSWNVTDPEARRDGNPRALGA